jgi:alpha-1,2-mannosyltransferase
VAREARHSLRRSRARRRPGRCESWPSRSSSLSPDVDPSCSRTNQVPIIAVDSFAYGRLTFPALNIVLYNLFSSAGPALYGTEPTSFYLVNLVLNYNLLLPLALLSLPALAITYKYDFKRLGSKQRLPVEGETSPYTLVALRLSGFYLWLGVLSAQAHKEERFMYPAYPLLAFNAAVTLFLVRGWVERAYIKATGSPYKVCPSS